MKRLLMMTLACVLINTHYTVRAGNCYFAAAETAPVKPGYADVKVAIQRLRAQLKQKYTLRDTAVLEKYFVQVVTDSIIPYWYGTPWDFNGVTQTPPLGNIACGYFVSTVLRDAGLPVNRVKMGQMSSEALSYALAEKKDIRLFYEKPLQQVTGWLTAHGPGLYIIGLESHVGFILVDAKGCWFIHAKWFGEKAVVKEDALTSSILYYAKYRMVAKISNSKKLLAAWLGRQSLGH